VTRADLEAAAAGRYPHYVPPTWEEGATKEDVVPSIDAEWQNAEADMQRAAYIQGRLDQAEADARIAEGYSEEAMALCNDSLDPESWIGMQYHGMHLGAADVAIRIRKGVGDDQGTAGC